MTKKIVAYLLLALTVSICLAVSSWALRCGSRIISVGDSKDKVEYACGTPSAIDSWEEEHFEHEPYYEPFWNGWRYERRTFYREVKVWVTVDRWTYNHGSTQFVQYMIFKNGILKEIETGEKGY